MNTLKFTSAAFALSLMCGASLAKLPAPSPEAAATAAAAKEKAAWNDKVAAYKLCLSQNKTASHYFKTKNANGKASVETPPCTDPGPLVAAIASMSFRERPARKNASEIRLSSASTWARAAISGTTPPKGRCAASCPASLCARIRRSEVTSAAAVSSQLDSMPRIRLMPRFPATALPASTSAP